MIDLQSLFVCHLIPNTGNFTARFSQSQNAKNSENGPFWTVSKHR